MKNPFRPKVRGGGYGCIVIIACALFFSSCENFLKGGEVAKQIEETIAYNNAKIVKVNLYSNDEMGIITPDSNYDARLGFNFKLQFIPNTQNYVITDPANVFEAVSIKDNSVSRADCVEFTPIEQTAADKKEGIYYAYAKVTKAADDIRIRPKCALVPKITSVWPPNDNTSYPQDSSIKVSFNKAINLSDFADENSQLKNITIKTGDTDLLDTTGGKLPYYKSPYLEDDGKTLVIPIVKGNYLIKDNSTKDISVSLKLESLTDGVEGENAAFIQKSYDFTFRIDSKKDTTPPTLKTLRIARTEEDARNGTNLIIMDEFTHYADNANYGGDSNVVATNIQNHHVNKVWIYFEGEDADSGVAGLEIREQLIRTTTGEEIQGIIYTRESSEPKKQNFFENPKEDNTYSACVEYNFNSDDDGVVKLDFILYDRAGKTTDNSDDSPNRVDVVKDTVCELELDIYNNTGYINNNQEMYPFGITLSTVNKSYIYIKDLDEIEYKDIFPKNGGVETNTAEIIGLYYGYDEDNLNYIDLQQTDYEILGNGRTDKCKRTDFNANPYKNIIVKGVIQDTAGNIKRVSKVIPAAMDVTFADLSTVTETSSIKLFINNLWNNQFYLYRWYQAELGTEMKKDTYIHLNSMEFYNGSVVSETLDNLFDNNAKNGYYSFTAYWLSAIPQGPFQFNSYHGKYITIKKENNIYTLVNISNEITPVSQTDVPVINVQADPPVKNAGTHSIHVTYQNFVPDPKLKYFIHYKAKDPGSCEGYSAALDFSVPSECCSYDFTAVVMNENGDSYESVEAVTIDLSEDNTPPVIKKTPTNPVNSIKQLTFYNLMPTFGTLKIKIEDKSLKNDTLTAKIKYVLSNTNDEEIEWSYDSRVRETELIEFEDTSTTDVWGFDIISYEQDYPDYCYVRVTDLYGNYTEDQYIIKGKKDKKLEVNYSNSSFSFTGGYNHINKTYIKTGAIDTWEKCANVEENSFMRLQPWYSSFTGGSGYKETFSEPVYFYPQYYISKETENPIVCDLKNISTGLFGLDISADQPCFVHTMYSPYNLGNTTQAWLNSGYETGLVMKKKSFTYSYNNTSAVPAGYYYTTIVHFADGTTLMTPVKQK